MVSLDIFHQDPFSTFQMTAAFERIPYLPSQLGDLGIFDPFPIRTTALGIENRDGVLNLIQTSERGAPPKNDRTTEKRKMRYFEVPRLEQGDTVYASEIQNVRAFGTETELMQIETEVARRVAGPTGLIPRLQYTWEHMRLGALQGKLLDADGSLLYDWFDEFGVDQPAVVPFNLAANVEFTLRGICNTVVRAMWRAAKGAFTTQTKIFALCGDQFWDELTQHVDVVKTYYNWQAAQELREGYAFAAMEFGGIHWFNYRGSDDNTTIKVPDETVQFFPVDAPGVFRQALAPGESFEWVNTPGKDWYLIPIFDRDRKFWWRVEAYSYPLFICTRPEVLLTGTAAGAGG